MYEKALFQDIAVVLPAKNEAENLKELLSELTKYVGKIIVVDGKSSDNTVEVAKSYGVDVVYGEGKGKADDLRLAQQYITNNSPGIKVITMADADNTYTADSIVKVALSLLNSDADAAFGVRYGKIPQEPGATTPFNKFFNKLLGYAVGLAYQDKDFRDPSTGLIAFKRKDFNNLPIRSNGFGLEAEIINYVLSYLKRIYVDIEYKKRKNGYTKLSFKEMAKIPFYFMKHYVENGVKKLASQKFFLNKYFERYSTEKKTLDLIAH